MNKIHRWVLLSPLGKRNCVVLIYFFIRMMKKLQNCIMVCIFWSWSIRNVISLHKDYKLVCLQGTRKEWLADRPGPSYGWFSVDDFSSSLLFFPTILFDMILTLWKYRQLAHANGQDILLNDNRKAGEKVAFLDL
jgi:hypothetical protein